jgi:hypothetical protein
MRFSSLALLASAVAAAADSAAPVCAAPPGIVPVLPEGLCYTTLVPTNKATGISIRQYGATPTNASIVSAPGGGAYLQAVPASIANALNYFSGQNDEQRNILSARIVPIAITLRGNYYTAHLGISPEQFPDDFLIPRPIQQGVTVTRVSANLGLVAAFAFNTTGLPYLENWQEACGAIQNSTLPSGYAINTTHPFSPTYVFYNGMTATSFTNECWMAVYKE